MSKVLFSSRECLAHHAPFGYPETGERLASIQKAPRLPVNYQGRHPEREQAIGAIHQQNYVESFERAVARGDGLLGSSDNPLSDGTWVAANAAVDTALHAVDWMMGNPGAEVFAAVRPPGHHAERDLAMGFCYFNTVAVAGEYALRAYELSRLAIFDFDVHHGNGTQHIFEQRADVLYLSTHQWPFYPGTGAANEKGIGAGEGATLNVPLPAGSGDEEYQTAIEGEILPAIVEFAPDALLVSAGFDAWQDDPLGGMGVTEDGFAEWGRLLRELAKDLCQGRLLSVLEGGYDLTALPQLVGAYLGEEV